MNIVRKDIDAVNALVTLQVSKADYEEKVEKTIRDYRKKANIPGFRPGMVPAGLVKKMYGKAVMAEEVNKVVSDGIYNYIKENNISLLGEPLPNETEQAPIDFETIEDFEFKFDIAIAPEFEITLDKKSKVKQYSIKLTDEMVDNQVKQYTGRFGSHVPAEIVEERDVLKVELVELDGKKVKEDGLTVADAVLTPAYVKNDKQKNLFIGKKVGDVITFNPKEALETEAEIASFLKISKEDAANVTADFQLTISGITRYNEAELNQDLFNKVFGEGEVTSEEEFVAKIKESIQQNLDADSDYKFGIDAQEVLVAKLDKVVFPDVFLKRWVLATNENLTAEKVDEDFHLMIADLKWHLIKEKISKTNDVKVEKEDIDAFGRKMALAQFAQYGMPNVPNDVLDGYVKDMLKDEKSIKNVVEGVLNEKVVQVIKDSVKLDTEEITIEDFNKMLEAK